MTLKPGDKVQVRKVWAYSHPEPLAAWFSGYTVQAVEYRGITVTDKHGTCTLWPTEAVRKDAKS